MNAAGWWTGTLLVAERIVKENLRSRSFRLITGLMLLLSIALITLPQVFAGDDTTYTLATVGPAPDELRDVLAAASDEGDFELEYLDEDSEAAVRTAVRNGDATAGLAGDRLFTSVSDGGSFPAVVAQAVVGLESTAALMDTGLTPAELEELATIRPPEQIAVQSDQEQARQGLAFGSGIVLYLALMFAGSAIATAVAVEKTSRISEVLLAVLRPAQTLVGTVLAVGALAMAQLLVVAVPLAVAVRVTDDIGLPATTTGDLLLAIAWFLCGFTLYAFVFAATAALVNTITEVSSAITPVTVVLLVVYVVAVGVVMPDPHSPWSAAASMFPLTAPIAMPIRWASGSVPVYQLVVAFALTLLAAWLFVRVASAVYQRALVVTGRRLTLREAAALARTR